ncbi:aladin-like [Anneissia japonica]|uniref:aladin-like n=1 Tax=Anneissia japonica TaxID=1529436 RepID=UPI001425B2A2|nr:aladin-like [Anneissia japonica]XP_033104096.1 aladin-like [Anneissia japonica]XP_033104097.1 aladin-like [Anneissia japonica]
MSIFTTNLVPPIDHVTTCEKNGELVCRPIDEANESCLQDPLFQEKNYPNVELAAESLRSLATQKSAKSAFLPCKETLWKRALQAWHEQGLCGALEVVAEDDSYTSTSWTPWLACASLAAVRWLNSLHGSLYPHLVLSNEDMISEFTSIRHWQRSEICALAWHPHTPKCAVALKDNSVKIFVAKSEVVSNLKHRLQKCVAALAWKHHSASVLAVACKTCILIWRVDPSSLFTRPAASAAHVLSYQGHGPVTSLAWDPRGELLASASPSDTAMLIWDVAKGSCTVLRRFGGGGVSHLRWAPDGQRLFAATPSQMFRVWETKTWQCERWTHLNGRCQAACWSPDGRILLFATENEPIIYSLTFNKESTTDAIGGSKAAVVCADLSESTYEIDGDEVIRVGGLVQDMTWSATGERLAVSFKPNENDDNQTNLVALFNVRQKQLLELIPIGFVQGEGNQVLQLISFEPTFNQGALLTLVWQDGRVTYVPLFFLSSQDVEHYQTSYVHSVANQLPQQQQHDLYTSINSGVNNTTAVK